MTAIRAIACALPEAEVTNEDLDREHPDWRMNLVGELSGIEARRVAAPGETALDLSLAACARLFAESDVDPSEIDAILYCTNYPDHPMPGNAQLLHARLGLADEVLAFDYRLACSGFVYGLAFADAFLRAEMASGVLLITAETASKGMNPGDRSVQALFGDGAAATFLSATAHEGDGTVVAHELRTHGAGFEYGYIPAGAGRLPIGEETKRETTDDSGNVRTLEDFHMDGTELWAFVGATVPPHIEAFLRKYSLTIDEIDLCVFHQASAMILNSISRALSIPDEKMFIDMRDVGNLSSASLPFALRSAIDREAIQPGDRVLISGFGIGISYGSAILRF